MNSGIVQEIQLPNGIDKLYGKVPMVKVEGTRETHGTEWVNAENCYETKEELPHAHNIRRSEKLESYCKEINTVEDLVTFCFERDTTSEFKDEDAIKAAQVRANELLGMNLGGYDPNYKSDLSITNEDLAGLENSANIQQ